MSTAPNKSRGFTIIEAIVAVALTSVGVVGAIGGIRQLTRSQTSMLQREKMYRLAKDKYDEIAATQDFTTPSGDFSDRSDPKDNWEMETNPTTTQNLSTLKITVHPSDSQDPKDRVVVSGLVFQAPQTSTTSAPTAGAGGG